jgi:uncharacterized protein (DUF488 family)
MVGLFGIRLLAMVGKYDLVDFLVASVFPGAFIKSRGTAREHQSGRDLLTFMNPLLKSERSRWARVDKRSADFRFWLFTAVLNGSMSRFDIRVRVWSESPSDRCLILGKSH